jgi:hypothetical protein
MNYNPTAPAVSKHQEEHNRSVGALVFDNKTNCFGGMILTRTDQTSYNCIMISWHWLFGGSN